MTRSAVRKKIKDKFGSLTRFYLLTGIDQYIYINTSATDLSTMCDVTKFRKADDDLTDALKNRIRKHLDAAGGPYKFCQDNPRFKYVSVMQMLSMYKKIRGVAQRLMHHFDIERD